METQYIGNMTFNFTKSLRDYEYTKRSVLDFNRVVSSKQFERMDSETIFRYLSEEMEIVSFGDYLKRYIYERASITEPFQQIPEEYYADYLSDSFTMNRAPHSFTPVRAHWGNIVRRWLRSGSVKRDTVFLLGFGLNMTEQDVSMFLTKVIKEQDFRLSDPREAIFWHCYHLGLPYAEALALMHYYETAELTDGASHQSDDIPTGKPVEESGETPSSSPRFWESAQKALPVYLSNPKMIKPYLLWLKTGQKDPQEGLSHEFELIYKRAADTARAVVRENKGLDQSGSKLSGAFDIESILYSGTGRTDGKNLLSASKSLLSKQIGIKRLSRQRLSLLLRKQARVERSDIITLMFLIYAVSVEKEWPTERLTEFIDETGAILERCDMMGIYPVNPYECFVLMCLLTEEPLSVFNDVWEMSYAED